MRRIKFMQGTIVALATIGIVLPQPRILASEKKPTSKPTIQVAAANAVFDVKLAKNNSFTGRVISHDGVPVVGAKVVMRQGKTEVGQSVTDDLGNFEFQNLKAGLYEVNSGPTAGHYRMWSERSAPPSAKPHGLLVFGENGTRGQYGLTETIAGENLGLILLAATTGLALSGLIIALHTKDTADEAKRIASRAFRSP